MSAGRGAAASAGILKGAIELLTGSSHGVAIILISLVQGLLVDLVLLVTRRHNLLTYMLAGGLSAASNVFVFQLLYFSGAPIGYILFISALAFVSGVLLAGSFGHSVLEVVLAARPLRVPPAAEEAEGTAAAGEVKRVPGRLQFAVTGLLVLLLAGGALYYYAALLSLLGWPQLPGGGGGGKAPFISPGPFCCL